jgi:hypothetical protein
MKYAGNVLESIAREFFSKAYAEHALDIDLFNDPSEETMTIGSGSFEDKGLYAFDLSCGCTNGKCVGHNDGTATNGGRVVRIYARAGLGPEGYTRVVLGGNEADSSVLREARAGLYNAREQAAEPAFRHDSLPKGKCSRLVVEDRMSNFDEALKNAKSFAGEGPGNTDIGDYSQSKSMTVIVEFIRYSSFERPALIEGTSGRHRLFKTEAGFDLILRYGQIDAEMHSIEHGHIAQVAKKIHTLVHKPYQNLRDRIDEVLDRTVLYEYRQDGVVIEMMSDKAYEEICAEHTGQIDHSDPLCKGDILRLRPLTFRPAIASEGSTTQPPADTYKQAAADLEAELVKYLKDIIDANPNRGSLTHKLFLVWRQRPEVHPYHDEDGIRTSHFIGYARFCAQWAEVKFAPTQTKEAESSVAREARLGLAAPAVTFGAKDVMVKQDGYQVLTNQMPPKAWNEAADLTEASLEKAIEDIMRIATERGVKIASPTQWFFTTPAPRTAAWYDAQKAKFRAERVINNEPLHKARDKRNERLERERVWEAGRAERDRALIQMVDVEPFIASAMSAPLDFSLRRTPPEAMLLPDSQTPERAKK